ncbi:6-phosphofructo-2-kinase/fructose-2,6-bisphosphatase-like isoform X2 [Phlebotomus argentipes]|uniref:6-phosphofructo-2-kinase/fructose-2, 6-bisphosphatase-like isoform X2 n=1 Tax=Phlebotomus argentipes TaxID=94469 RepID=UPI0028931DFD|nr:6-phosphofructo-2-kinase/fructose-2,6-bisphosphatase-like isoform X2 [Phlebotomus argentipes]
MFLRQMLQFVKSCQKMSRESPLTVSGHQAGRSIMPCVLSAPLVVTLVGLPCRGKSFAAHRIARHLNWRGESAKVFTVDEAATPETLKEILAHFQSGNNVAIIDGMHLTRQSRQAVSAFCSDTASHHILVEISCDDVEVTDNMERTLTFYEKRDKSTDWRHVIQEKVHRHLEEYEPCSAAEAPLIAVSASANPALHAVTARGIQGALQTVILGVLASPLIKEHVFYFTRHGESKFNMMGRIGGDSGLSERGAKYAERLAIACPAPKLIWTSELERTIATARAIPGARTALKELNEINAGICEGLTYEEIQERFPQEFAWRDQDKLKYRYPHGESYLDLLQRVDNVIQGLITASEVLVVSHQAVLRCIMAYFMGTTPEDVPYINVPLHTLLVVRSRGYEFEVEPIPLKVECVDTYRVQPQNCSPGRTDADALQTVPAHFDAPLPQVIN